MLLCPSHLFDHVHFYALGCERVLMGRPQPHQGHLGWQVVELVISGGGGVYGKGEGGGGHVMCVCQ